MSILSRDLKAMPPEDGWINWKGNKGAIGYYRWFPYAASSLSTHNVTLPRYAQLMKAANSTFAEHYFGKVEVERFLNSNIGRNSEGFFTEGRPDKKNGSSQIVLTGFDVMDSWFRKTEMWENKLAHQFDINHSKRSHITESNGVQLFVSRSDENVIAYLYDTVDTPMSPATLSMSAYFFSNQRTSDHHSQYAAVSYSEISGFYHLMNMQLQDNGLVFIKAFATRQELIRLGVSEDNALVWGVLTSGMKDAQAAEVARDLSNIDINVVIDMYRAGVPTGAIRSALEYDIDPNILISANGAA